MEYTKPPLTFEQQADLLISRGLIANRAELIQRLQTVNYYRLSGYLYPFRENDTTFRVGTTLDKVWHHYIFDRRLRMLVMDAVERVEVAVRTHLAYHFARKFGPFSYTDPSTFPTLQRESYDRWLNELTDEVNRSNEEFIERFFSKYGNNHVSLPVWMLVEVMSFGKTLTFYRGVDKEIRKQVAEPYGVHFNVLESWLRSLNAVRNICAHHGRLWNRELGYKPLLPKERKNPEWYIPVAVPQERVFVIVTILRYLLRYAAPTSKWSERLILLLDENKEILRRSMGFPERWEESPLWK
ncbi:MAG: Abi family protein [Ignavibacteriales bacterium]|nr:Abi family protein [Ignavibacteriales bacterium]